MGANRNDLENWIEEVMRKKGVNKYTIDLAGSTSKGDGYLGVVTFVKVKTQTAAGEMLYDLVVKSAKKGEELRKQTPIQKFYFRYVENVYFFNGLELLILGIEIDCRFIK